MPPSYRSHSRAKRASTRVPGRLPARLRVVAMLTTVPLLASCSLPYYWQAIGGQFNMLRSRTPIEEVLADPQVDEDIKAPLARISQIRQFAVSQLQLPDNGSYTSYVDLGRPYAVWNVIAAEEFSTKAVKWCFPFAGCVAYRGFFDRQKAERFRAKLDARGFDTYAGGAGAYSTLGYFQDPVLNTMVSSGEIYAAGIVFHELAHQKLYVKGDSRFNEAFATAIQEYGTRRWLHEQDAVDAIEAYNRRIRRRDEFAALVQRQQRRLAGIYARGGSAREMRAAKAESFERMRDEYEELKREWGGGENYDAWFAQDLNNAVLAATATYTNWLPALRARLSALGLTGFYEEMAQLAELSNAERRRRLDEWLLDPATGGSVPDSVPHS